MTDIKHGTKRNARHTVGPWRYQEGADAYTHIVRTDRNRFLCQLAQDPSGEAEANGRLIAAAPRMRETLESIIRIAEMRDDNRYRPEGLFELLRDISGEARAAIAEAKELVA